MDDRNLLTARPRIPEHVVARSFGGEAVALNLHSAHYHGLNGVAARMFDGLRTAGTVGELVDPLAAEFDQPREVIESDLIALVRALSERGLVELDAGHGA
jgi:hypothetical protein